MALTLLSALEQLARYAREEGLTDQEIFAAVAEHRFDGGDVALRAEAEQARHLQEVVHLCGGERGSPGWLLFIKRYPEQLRAFADALAASSAAPQETT